MVVVVQIVPFVVVDQIVPWVVVALSYYQEKVVVVVVVLLHLVVVAFVETSFVVVPFPIVVQIVDNKL